jgi:hypothetical protein
LLERPRRRARIRLGRPGTERDIGFAVATEEIVAYPNEPADGPVAASLRGGVALFVGFSAVSYRRLPGRHRQL